jgi:CMP-N,N'-diacetyllegionaminic acid synthase
LAWYLNVKPTPNKTIAFDLDGTLCSLTSGFYENAVPFVERIKHVNELGLEGNRILIFTARGATSGKDLSDLTKKQLDDWGLSYDELIFGKPHFDLLVDDKALSEFQYFGKYGL